jgi:Zn-dependent protease with chaperone function
MWASYFTNQTFIGIMIYFFANIVFYCVDKNGKLKGRINNSVCHTIVHMFYNALFPLAILVTVIFWGMIFPVLNTSYFNFYHWSGNVIQHLFQSVFLGIDWYLITVPTSVSHAIPMIIVGVAYLIFSQIYHSIYDIWIYPFLDHSNKYWYVIYIALIIAWCIFGVIFSLIQNFKNRKREFVGEENEKNKADIINV